MKKQIYSLFVILNLFISQNALANDYLITKDRVGDIKLGMSYTNFLKIYPNAKKSGKCQSDEKPGLYTDELFVTDYDYICEHTNRKIKSISVYSSKYKTFNGLKVGMTINDILKIYPKIKVEIALMDEEEFITVKTTNNLSIVFFVNTGKEGKFVGNYKNFPTNKITNNFDKNGKIYSIEIYHN